MLQQTTVPTVVSYYEKFLRLWPRVGDLAAAPVEDVLREWAGLGYYARARNLHKCANTVATQLAGHFPASVEGLLDLPGIGPYTASAVGAMAFGLPTVPVDGNVERVVTRLYRIAEPVARAKPQIRQQAQDLFDQASDVFSGDLAQALMDLGATICTPRSPKCHACPISQGCAAFKAGDQVKYPVPPEKKDKPTRYGYVYLVRNAGGEYLLERRPEKGLLGGMLGLPTTEWVPADQIDALNHALHPKQAQPQGEIHHTFTHFHLILNVFSVNKGRNMPVPDGIWCRAADIKSAGLPKVFLKASSYMMT